MYPIHDTDAQLLLATLIAAKRRPAALTDIVAAAEFMGFPVTAPAAWATASPTTSRSVRPDHPR